MDKCVIDNVNSIWWISFFLKLKNVILILKIEVFCEFWLLLCIVMYMR